MPADEVIVENQNLQLSQSMSIPGPGGQTPTAFAFAAPTFAGQGLAGESSWPVADVQRHLRETMLLNRVIAAASSALEPDVVMEIVCKELAQAFDLQQAAFAMLDEAHRQLVVTAEYHAVGRPPARGAVIPIAGNEATQYVLEHRMPLVLQDAQHDPRQAVIHDLEKQRGTVSLLIVPVLIRGEVVGTLGLDAIEYHEFSPDEISLAQSVAAAVSQMLENARLYAAAQRELAERRRAEEALARRAREMEALYQTSLEITAQLDLPALLQAIVQRASDLVGVRIGGLYLLHPLDSTLELVVSHNLPGQPLGARLEPGEGLSGRVAQTGEPMMVVDYAGWEGRALLYADHAFGRVLAVPLKVGQRIIGVLDVTDDERTGLFGEDEVRLVSLFADQAAIAIENARLYASEQDRAEVLADALEQQRLLDDMQRQFMQNVSHELRTPLTLILSHAELLDSGILGELAAGQRESLEVILRRAKMLSHLVNDIISLLEAEQRAVQRQQVNLTRLVEVSLAEFKAVFETNGIAVSVEMPSGVLCVEGDELDLRRVVDNLLGNALKFTGRGGSVVVRLQRSGADVVLEVVDTGIGIPSQMQSRIFDRFYQVDSKITRRNGGVGLGLALVKEIVEAHSGQIGVASTMGVGTTFTIRLPACLNHRPA